MSCAHRAWPILLVLSGRIAAQNPRPLYRDSTRPVAVRARDLLSRMTPQEKFWQLFMIPGDLSDSAHDYSHGIFGLQIRLADTAGGPARAEAVRINAIQRYFVEHTRLGIPIIPFEEAVHGLMRPGATVFPAAVALGATWDTALVARVAAAIARETASRGIRQVLAPVLNLARDVRWGRVEETYGEDPYLVSAMGRAFVGTLEHAGIVTTPKHFVANVGDGGRDSYPIDYDERLLAETYFPPFESAIRQAGARSVMTAYNSVDGAPATQNRLLLTGVLKRRWRFPGFVISDAAATGGATVLHLTEPNTAAAAKDALDAGLDVIFQSSYEQYRPYWDAFRNGMIADAVIDSAVARVLRVKFALGLFEHPYVDPDSAAVWNGHAAHRALARDAAREGIVLLQNARRVLPLGDTLRSLAVIGSDAVEARLGGYSGPGNHPVSMLEGIRAHLGATQVGYAPGPGRVSRELVTIPAEALRPGLTGEYFDNIALEGRPLIVRRDALLDFGWTLSSPGPGLARDWYSVRWSGTFSIPAGGVRRLGVVGSDGFRLFLDDSLLIDDWQKRSAGTHVADVALAAGSGHAIRLEFFETTGNAHVRLVWDAGVADDWRAQIDSAARLARRSQVAIVVAGVEEGEFRDRAFLGLPGHQEDLIQAVASTGTPVVVVIVGGSAVTMPWLDRVDGVLDVWYPGEAGGQAVADVLFGDADPAGRLPITFPVAEGQLPLVYDHKPTGRGDDYVDLTGQPLFPFGFGLSYTAFTYSGLTIEPAVIHPGESAVVRCRVRNVGGRAGDEVVQLYLHDELASVPRPVLQLAGFQRLRLAPGEEREVAFRLGTEQLRLLDRELHWVVEPGTFRILIGGSSKDIRLRGALRVQ
ncbi:MAG: glycoside hydrolase family 3 N-terminal domain-containing protein [Gemmatimonadota bacterium]